MSAAATLGSAARAAEPHSAPKPSPGRIVAVNRFFWPDHAATSQILADLAFHLASRGWRVTVVTSRTRYDNAGEPLAAREVVEGVSIRRVRTSRLGRRRLARRAIDYLTFYVSAGAALLREARRGDVILVTTDPPLFSVVAAVAAALKGARLVTWNHDVFPEVSAALGLSWTGGLSGRAIAGLRNWSLGRAVCNVAIGELMAGRLEQAGAREGSVRVVPNWSDARIHPVPAEHNRLRRDWGLGDALVIGYSGNLGRAHMPDKVAELVRRTHDLPGLRWLFIGGGAGMDRIRALAGEIGEAGVQIRPYQTRDDLAESLSVPDLHLVALDPACEGLIVPSKISGICAAGRPILYLGNPSGDLAQEVLRHQIGTCLDPAAPRTWRETVAVLKADADRLAEMGRRARAASEAAPPCQSLARWEAVLAEASAGARRAAL